MSHPCSLLHPHGRRRASWVARPYPTLLLLLGGSPLPDTVTPLRLGVRRHNAEASGELLGALQCSFTLFETGAMIAELIFKGWIALDSVPTAVTFFPLECIAELHHASSNAPRDMGRDADTVSRMHVLLHRRHHILVLIQEQRISSVVPKSV